jgi:hypothetical protein
LYYLLRGPMQSQFFIHTVLKRFIHKQLVLPESSAFRVASGPVFNSYRSISPTIHASTPDLPANRAGRPLQFPGYPTDLFRSCQPPADSLPVTSG